MNIKGFALDIDGTITEDGGIISLDAAYTIRWLEKLGYRIIFVTARSVWEGLALSTFLGTTKITVGENGGIVAKSPTDMILLADISYSLRAYDYLSKKLDNVKEKPSFPRLTEVVLQRTFDREEGNRILKEGGLPIIINDSKYGYHLNYETINKAKGLLTALKYFDLKASEIIAIGDSEIDVPMFSACGYSVAMGNSSEYVKKNANFSVNAKMGNGFLEAIQHIVDRFFKGEG